jgi:hypothetical protein
LQRDQLGLHSFVEITKRPKKKKEATKGRWKGGRMEKLKTKRKEKERAERK